MLDTILQGNDKAYLIEVKNKGPIINGQYEGIVSWFLEEAKNGPGGIISLTEHEQDNKKFFLAVFNTDYVDLEKIKAFLSTHGVEFGDEIIEVKNSFQSVWPSFIFGVVAFLIFFFLVRLLASWVLILVRSFTSRTIISNIFWAIQVTFAILWAAWSIKVRQWYNAVMVVLAFGLSILISH